MKEFRESETQATEEFEMWKVCALVKSGRLSADAFAEAVWQHFESRPPLGELAIKHGFLTMPQLFTVLGKQEEAGLPFGETAVDLGYFTRDQLARLLHIQQVMAMPVEEILDRIGDPDWEVIRSEEKTNFEPADNVVAIPQIDSVLVEDALETA